MGRASATGVDALISVVEPGMRSVQTAAKIQRLAADIGIERTFVVANKIRQPHQLDVLQRALVGQKILGTLPFSEALAQADLEGRSVSIDDPKFSEALENIGKSLEDQLND
jgi:CO dehydrogenase maturation factor